MANPVDEFIFDFVQRNLQNSVVQYIARDITSLGGDTLSVLFTIFITGVLWLSDNKGKSVWFAGTMAVTAVLIVTLKLLINRPCPLQPDPYQHPYLGDFPTGVFTVHLPCMPSGHTTGSTVLSMSVLYLILRECSQSQGQWKKWLSIWLTILPVVIGLTRIILSAHWMTDVVSGYILGRIIVYVSQNLRDWVEFLINVEVGI